MLTSKGFIRKRYADILPEIEAQAKELWGADVNLSERSPLGKFIKLQAYSQAQTYELAEKIYYSAYIDFAEGVHLDYAVKQKSLTRQEWRKAVGTVLLNMPSNATTAVGTLLAKANGVKYKTLTEVKSLTAGSYPVEVECLEYGEIGNAEVGEIAVIINPTIGLASVSNPEPIQNGQDEETDEELRQRYHETPSKQAGKIEAIRARVLDEVEGIRACIVIENDTMVTDSEGRPPKSFETITLGGDDEDIAQKIYDSKGGGIQAYGTQTAIVTDSMGNPHTIGFSVGVSVPIWVKVQVKKNLNYPLDGDTQVKTEILKYIGGDDGATIYHGLTMGEKVTQWKAMSRLSILEGIDDVEIQFSTNGTTYSEANIPITFRQVAETEPSKIEVTYLA